MPDGPTDHEAPSCIEIVACLGQAAMEFVCKTVEVETEICAVKDGCSAPLLSTSPLPIEKARGSLFINTYNIVKQEVTNLVLDLTSSNVQTDLSNKIYRGK